ncbi:hypothetical protein M0804_002496 [Polistes exclamans]|nr:hypothetical protein M0804_002496 [Polistes exclamans]
MTDREVGQKNNGPEWKGKKSTKISTIVNQRRLYLQGVPRAQGCPIVCLQTHATRNHPLTRDLPPVKTNRVI